MARCRLHANICWAADTAFVRPHSCLSKTPEHEGNLYKLLTYLNHERQCILLRGSLRNTALRLASLSYSRGLAFARRRKWAKPSVIYIGDSSGWVLSSIGKAIQREASRTLSLRSTIGVARNSRLSYPLGIATTLFR